jgi:hypothetical protein
MHRAACLQLEEFVADLLQSRARMAIAAARRISTTARVNEEQLQHGAAASGVMGLPLMAPQLAALP